MGAAIQSHWFAVGRHTLWSAEQAQGFVLCQAFQEATYGMQALHVLQQQGMSPASALAHMRASDPGEASRQVCVMGADGALAAYTGSSCLAHAEHVVDESLQVSCQANLMVTEGAPQAMLQAYREHARQPFVHRLLAAMYAAQALEGPVRGRQSAAMLVSSPHDAPGTHFVDLRVDDSSNALARLDGLLHKWEAYQTLNRLQTSKDPLERKRLYVRLLRLTSEPEILFWADLAANPTQTQDTQFMF